MYEDIRRPTLLKHIPLLLIRGLSTVYYFSKYAQNQIPEKINALFISNLDYLGSCITEMGTLLSRQNLQTLAQEMVQIKKVPVGSIQKVLEETTVKLSEACEAAPKEIERAYKELRMTWIERYKNTVEKIKVLVVDNNQEPERVEKIATTLKNFCYYDAGKTGYPSPEYSGMLTETDFAFFASTRPAHIHDLAKSLKAYRKPGLAVVHIEKEMSSDEQAIRHGAQLQRVGFYVLYKVFTPIRLFTSIDKVYMKYYLENERL